MAIKVTNPKVEVSHVIMTNSAEKLNEFVSEKLSLGYELKEARLVAVDNYNQAVTMFYLFVWKTD